MPIVHEPKYGWQKLGGPTQPFAASGPAAAQPENISPAAAAATA
jgi:hypothetical protein